MVLTRCVISLTLLACLLVNEAVRGRSPFDKFEKRPLGALGVTAKLDRVVDTDEGHGSALTETLTFLSHAAESKKEEALLSMNMSIAKAMDIVTKLPQTAPEFLQNLQEFLHLSTNNLRRKQPDGGVAAAQAAGSYGGGAQKALDMLNNMILEAIEKMDFEVIRCDSEERTNLQQLEAIRQDIIMFNGMAAGAATTLNKAKGDATRFQGLLSQSKNEFETNKKICDVERTDLEQKLTVVTSDLSVMRTVVAMTDCGDSAAAASMFQCTDKKTNRTWTEYRPQKKFSDLIAKVHNAKVRQILTGNQIFMQETTQPVVSQDDAKASAPPPMEDTAGDITKAAQANAKCSLASSPMCPIIREKFTNLAGEVFDSWNELKLMLKNLNLHCEETLDSISSQITNYDNVISETNEKMTGATKDWGTYSGQKNQKDSEYNDVHKEHTDTMTACRVNIGNLASEKCALKKIRGELLKMDSLPSIVTDCDVGEWTPEACSVSCGGGTQVLTRSLTPGQKGAACPAGEAKQSCNEQRCPVDCVMEEWSEWGSCTALCDAGIKERARGIRVPALTKAAVQCEETAETVPCNVQACSGDCILGDWTSWDPSCSKPCGGGETTRTRPLVKPAFGTGTCPEFYNDYRHEVRKCNTMECPRTRKPFKCASKMDVVILIDGSGSLGQEGWEAVKLGGQQLSQAFNGPDVRVSSLLFSGPTDFDKVGPCIGQINPFDNKTAAQLDAILDCGMEWVTRFEENLTGDAMSEKLGEMKFPEGTTLTSMALAEASAELSHGREDANSIVFVLTDGAPLSQLECSKQSEHIKNKARLFWVPIGNAFMDDSVFEPWASVPHEENIFRIKDLKWIGQTWLTNMILSEFCRDIMVQKRNKEVPLSEMMKSENGISYGR